MKRKSDFGNSDIEKRLDFVKVSFEKLVTGQSLTVKIKANDATTWTTIGSYSTANEISKTFTNIEATGVSFPSGKEYKFRLESTGGLVVTAIELISTLLSGI